MKNNPIRKRRSVHLKNPHGGTGTSFPGFWYAVCPKCNATVKAVVGLFGGLHSRKNAKDTLHLHMKKEHS